MIQRYDVVINGGGMTGLALGCALGQQGRQVAVIETQGEPPRFNPDTDYDLRVVALNQASQNLLDHLGAWQQLLRWRVSPYQRMYVWDAGSPGHISFTATELGTAHLGHIIENRLIQRALYERFTSLATTQWIGDAAMERIAVDEHDALVSLTDGRILNTRLVVGADGRHSQVRQAANIDLRRRDYHQQGIVAIVRSEQPSDFTAWQRFLPDGVLAFLPLSDGRASIVWSSRRADELLALPDSQFKQALGKAFDFHLGEILQVSPRASFPLIGRHAKSYISPRIVLIGDAAHTIHPLAGQGVNLGFMDVAALTEVIGQTTRDFGSLSVLRRYERSRRGENAVMQRLMEGFQFLFINNNSVLSGIRGLGLRLTDQATPLKNQMMRYAMGIAGERPAIVRPPVDQLV